MSSVDSRIVTIKFDAKQFQQGASETMSTLDKLKASLSFSGSTKGLDNLAASTSNVESGVSKISAAFIGLSAVAVTAIANITTKMMGLAGQTAMSLAGIDAMRDGFADYELKVGATQTIMSGTGENIGQVTKYLKDLDIYADKTIYSLSDMTSNIGKFTNAGVKLPVAVDAMKGIANVAALSGANSQEAARAMYNLGQAIGNGTVKLMDWKSVELANMGTKEFKEQLIDGAVAAGTLTKGLDGTIKSAKGTEVNFKTFSKTLAEGWLTSDALTDTLGKYADETTDIGKKAYKAATEVKTFSMMMETLKAAAGTGWTDTFETVIGTLPEATKLFTGMSNAIGGVIGRSADARNALLKNWKELGGRKDLIKGFKNLFGAIGDILGPVKQAFRAIFPPMISRDLFEITEGFKKFTKGLRLSDETMANLKSTFKGVFAIFSIVGQIIKGVAGFIFDLVGAVDTGGGGFLRFTAKIGEWLASIDKALKKGDDLKKFFAGISGFLAPVIALISGFGVAIASAVTGKATDAVETFGAKFDGLKTIFNGVKSAIEGIFTWISAKMSSLADLFSFKEAGSNVEGSMGKVLLGLNAGLFAGILLAIRSFTKNLKGGLGDLRGIFTSISGVFGSAGGVLDQVTSNLKTMQADVKADIILKIASALAILAAAIFVLSQIDPKKLAVALTAVALMLAELAAAIKLMDKATSGGGSVKITILSVALIALSVALLAMSAAIAVLGNMETETIVRGMTAVAAILALVTSASALMSKAGGGPALIVAAAAILVLSAALVAFAGALKLYSSLDTGTMVSGGLKIAASLAAIALVMSKLKLGPSMLVSAVTLIIVAEALVILAGALKIMGSLSVEEMAKSLITLGLALGIIAIGLNFMSGAIGGAAALIVFAAALSILVPPLILLGQLDLKSLGMALLGLVGVFTVLGLAGVILGPLIPVLLALGASIALLGVAVLAIGAGLALFATGLSILAASGAAGVAVLIGAITSIIRLFPLIMRTLAQGIVEFARMIGNSAPQLVAALGKLVRALLKELETIIPLLPPVISKAITAFLKVIRDNQPKFIQAGIDWIAAIIDGLAKNVGRLAKKAGDLVIAFLDAWATQYPRMADAGAKALIKFINGMSNAIDSNSGELGAAGGRLGVAIIKGMAKGVLGGIGEVASAAKQAASAALNAAKSFLGIKSPSKEFEKVGEYAMEGFADGVVGGLSDVEAALDKMREMLGDALADAKNDVDEAKARVKSLEKIKKPNKSEKKALAEARKDLTEAKALYADAKDAQTAFMTTYAAEQQQLRDLGTQYDDVTEKLKNAKSALDSATQARDNAYKGFQSQYSALPDITAETSLDKYKEDLQNSIIATKKFKATLDQLRALGMDDVTYNKFLAKGTEAQPFLDALLASGSGGIAELNVLDAELANAASALGSKAASDLYQTGVDAAQGLVNGLTASQASIEGQMTAIGNAMVAAINKALGIKSPSKAFAQVGRFANDGLAKGLKQYSSEVTDASEDLGKLAIDSLKSTMDKLTADLALNLDSNPVITPVLDLTKFQSDAKLMDAALGGKSVNANVSFGQASGISQSSQEQQSVAFAGVTGAQEPSIIFEQNNYSPTALSPVEIYRQTKNQLSLAKGVLT